MLQPHEKQSGSQQERPLVPQRDVPADHRSAEDEAQSSDLEELEPRSDGLHRDNLEPSDGYVAEEGAGGHVTHHEENWVLEAIIREEVLVEEEDADVGGVQGGDQAHGEVAAR
ncbi:uncharacterized protein A4U43_C07F23960 [Asparagus officinalis]|uniref:Uncharacterized protein n=1 Tax=Asparagus officinalis TaxID=4686 RepID=A0A5P1EEL4_ASPOF|nr:uncharacterized protein A4U43_C07F23960 [Asparagus officinalis]